MDNNMTIGEMIDAYANFGRTREYYDFYKECVTFDLKVQYALCESYMQECSVNSFFEDTDFWGGLVAGAIKIFETIKNWLKKIWFHISRFFHSIFRRTTNWYKKDDEYKKTIRAAYREAAEKSSESRLDASDVLERAVAAFAKGEDWLDSSVAKASRLSDKLDTTFAKYFNNITVLTPEKKLKIDLSVNVEKIGSTDDYKISGKAPKAADYWDSNKSNQLTDKGKGLMYDDYNTSITRAATDIKKALGQIQMAGTDCAIGISVDTNAVDEICKLLKFSKTDDKVSSISDALNHMYMFAKPPLTVNIPESFDLFLRKTNELNAKLKKIVDSGDMEKANNIVTQWSSTVGEKLTEKEKNNSFIEKIIEEEFTDKIENTSTTLSKVLKKIDDYNKTPGKDYSKDSFGSTGAVDLEIDKIAKNDRKGAYANLKKTGAYDNGISFNDLKVNKTVITAAIKLINERFSKIAKGMSYMINGVSMVHEYRLYLAREVRKIINSRVTYKTT